MTRDRRGDNAMRYDFQLCQMQALSSAGPESPNAHRLCALSAFEN